MKGESCRCWLDPMNGGLVHEPDCPLVSQDARVPQPDAWTTPNTVMVWRTTKKGHELTVHRSPQVTNGTAVPVYFGTRNPGVPGTERWSVWTNEVLRNWSQEEINEAALFLWRRSTGNKEQANEDTR